MLDKTHDGDELHVTVSRIAQQCVDDVFHMGKITDPIAVNGIKYDIFRHVITYSGSLERILRLEF